MATAHVRAVDRCANVACENRGHEGSFSTVTVKDHSPIAGAPARPIVLLLCTPCGAAVGAGARA